MHNTVDGVIIITFHNLQSIAVSRLSPRDTSLASLKFPCGSAPPELVRTLCPAAWPGESYSPALDCPVRVQYYDQFNLKAGDDIEFNELRLLKTSGGLFAAFSYLRGALPTELSSCAKLDDILYRPAPTPGSATQTDSTSVMSAPQEGYPPQGYPQQDPYGQQPQHGEQQPQYGEQQPQHGEQQPQPGFGAASPPPAQEQLQDAYGKKKKRGYAAQAYDFGAGGNTAVAGAPPANNFAPISQQAYGGYPAPVEQPAYGGTQPYQDAPQPAPSGFGQSALSGLGGYQAPPAAYPGPGAGDGMGGVTQGMGQMGLGQQPAQPNAPGAAKLPLNQLYPTDLLNQPFNVSELELPPPPIILPPNVS